jgi:hypothetical protein
MIKMIDISDFIATTLDENIEFQSLCTSLTTKTFDYFVNVDLHEVEVPIPYFGIVTFENNDDKEVKKGFKTQLLLGIDRESPIKTGNITKEPTAEKLEEISLKAIEIVSKEMRTYGINGDTNIMIDYINYYVPNPEGEDDLQMQIDIQFTQDKFLSC